MNNVAIWAEMLAVPVLIGIIGVVICMLRDRHDVNHRPPLSHR